MSQPEKLPVLDQLMKTIQQRKATRPGNSYTAQLLDSGLQRIGAKVTEEADELVAAAAGESPQRVVQEAADLLYHVLVLLAACDLTLDDVQQELARRQGRSGLDEKASRCED